MLDKMSRGGEISGKLENNLLTIKENGHWNNQKSLSCKTFLYLITTVFQPVFQADPIRHC
jgi:hypothetical protein